ncbi:hypothetical protein [Streptomyces sp. NPDC048644]|uniref:hypothetical protein n=1 Tax=Streptomyces sp. NPDC048644 TaxID=3365582 RepID=UPI0037157DE1
MTHSGVSPQAMAASGLVHHLMTDLLIKGAIVVAAVLVLAVGMAVIWRRAGRRPPARRD